MEWISWLATYARAVWDAVAQTINPIFSWMQHLDGTDWKSVSINVLSQYVYLASGPLAVAGMIAIWSLLSNRARTTRVALGIPVRAKSVAIVFGLIPPASNAKKRYFSVEEGDVHALMHVYGSVRELIRPNKPNIVSHVDSEADLLKCRHVISLSGPVWNPITRLLLDVTGCPVRFNLNNKTLEASDVSWKTTYSEQKTVQECYGLILRATRRTHDGKKQNCIVICGLSNLSTLGASLVLENLGSQLRRKSGWFRARLLARGRSFCLIVHVRDPSSGDKGSPRVPVRQGRIEAKIVRVFSESDFKSHC